MKIIEERNSMEFFYVFVFVPIFNMNKEEKKIQRKKLSISFSKEKWPIDMNFYAKFGTSSKFIMKKTTCNFIIFSRLLIRFYGFNCE